MSVLAGIYAFLQEHQGDIASKMVASAGYDLLKKSLDFKALKNKLKGLFKKEEQQEQFVKELCEQQIDSNAAPEDAVRAIYEKISGEPYNADLFALLKEWVEENKAAIQNLNNISISNSSGFNIGVQNAQHNIYNVQGDINMKPDDGH